MLDWPTKTVVGWRWESIDTAVPAERFATFVTEGDRATLGSAMPSFPDGQWSEPARCWWTDVTRQNSRHTNTEAPVEDCVCGYRVCRTLQTACRYMFPYGRLAYHTNPLGLVLVRVQTQGKLVTNDYDANLGPWNCVSAAQIRPVWPAFTVDEKACQRLREHYGTNEIHYLPDWTEGAQRDRA